MSITSRAFCSGVIGKSLPTAQNLAYIIGKPEPSSINIELDKNCNKIDDIKEWILKNVDLTPYGIIKRFGGDIPRNAYTQFKGFYGHNTSDDNKCKLYFPWEKLDLIDELKELCNIHNE